MASLGRAADEGEVEANSTNLAGNRNVADFGVHVMRFLLWCVLLRWHVFRPCLDHCVMQFLLERISVISLALLEFTFGAYAREGEGFCTAL